ncbi:MAG: shikimate dehydrogenase family protein [Saprospiraceae bacterium]
MKMLGLIGYPLSHSFSKKYFTEKFEKKGIEDYKYELFPLKNIEELTNLLVEHPSFRGLNVTIPYKEAVLPFLKKVSEEAAAIGAVNTIKIENGVLTGYNTDVYGFEKSIFPFLKPHHKKALIFGTGGASKAVRFTLSKLGIEYKFVSRNPDNSQLSYQAIDEAILSEYQVIVNTTPLGMSPKVDSCPDIPYHFLNKKHLLYDLVYNPSETLFLKKGRKAGASIKNGMEMLVLQAEKSWEIYGDYSE